MNTPDLPFTDPGDPTRDGLAQLLGIEPVEWGGGRSELALLVDERHLRNMPILHGGVLATLLDSALGVAASSVAPANRLTVTAQLNVNFIRPAFPGERLVAVGRCDTRVASRWWLSVRCGPREMNWWRPPAAPSCSPTCPTPPTRHLQRGPHDA